MTDARSILYRYPAQRNVVVDEGAFMSELSARVTTFGGQGIWETKTKSLLMFNDLRMVKATGQVTGVNGGRYI